MAKDNDIVVIGGLGLLAYYLYSQQTQTPYTYPSPAPGTPGFVGPVQSPYAQQPGTGEAPPIAAVGEALAKGTATAVKYLGEGVAAVATAVYGGAKAIVTAIASTGPIGIAAAAAVIAGLVIIEVFRSNAHNVANEIVQQLENPFHSNLSNIIDPKDAAANAGTLTCDEEAAAIQAVQTLWNNYHDAVSEFALKGGDYALVAQQSLDNLNGPNGVIQYVPPSERYGANGFIDAVIAKMQWHMSNVLGC